jgi:Lrp/AsnC family leucine-responsive transcriptional regulator
VEDDIDRQIVRRLSEEGRAVFADIARETGLSTSALHQRVKRLEARGVIKGYKAIIAREEIGQPLTAFVSLTPIDPIVSDAVPQLLNDIAEVESCWSVAGAESYILKVNVATPLDLENLLSKIRTTAQVSTRTTIVLSTPFEERPPAL